MRAALVDGDGAVLHRRSEPTNAPDGRDAVMGRLAQTLREVALSVDRSDVVGVGLSVASPTDPETGIIYNAPNLPGWDGFAPGRVLEQHLSMGVVAANDSTLATLAEHTWGAGRGSRHMLCLTLGTGIGGGVVIDGKLYMGSRGVAGELGHMIVDPTGPRCPCGSVGCLEVLASGTAVGRLARERLAAGGTSSLDRRVEGNMDRVDARMVAEAAASGDDLAGGVMAEVAAALGAGLANLVRAFDPELIALGGGMSQSLDLLLPGIKREMESRALVPSLPQSTVVASELGDDAGLMGAGSLAFQALGEARGDE